jgi:hypothetical protein
MSMKKLATLSALLAVWLMAGTAKAGIVGSAHDFSSFAWAKTQICLPCHTPHNAIVKDADGATLGGPIWNHQLSALTTYTLYYDETGTAHTGKVDTNSRLCLSCHDGTVALDSFGGLTGSQYMTNAKMIVGKDGDLGNDHPIGEHAVWPTPNPSYMVDPALRDAARIMPLRVLSDGRKAVGCTSCHEPHNRRNTENMLWMDNTKPAVPIGGTTAVGSPLCLSCHKK